MKKIVLLASAAGMTMLGGAAANADSFSLSIGTPEPAYIVEEPPPPVIYSYPSYYGGYGGYYGGYSPYYGYRVARRSSAIVLARAKSPIVLARAKKNSEIALAGAKIRNVHGVASLASSTATSSRTHPPKRVQGRFATGGNTARNAI